MDENGSTINIGSAKKDPISNNSNKFKEGVTVMPSDQPGIKNRIVKLKNSKDNNAVEPSMSHYEREDENPDDWMRDLTPEQVEVIMNGELSVFMW